jgi:hypothetical protein
MSRAVLHHSDGSERCTLELDAPLARFLLFENMRFEYVSNQGGTAHYKPASTE